MFARSVLVLLALTGGPTTLSAPSRLAEARLEGGAQQPQRGAETMASYCRSCHGLSLIAQQRLAPDDWTREVDKMMRWGARVPDNQKQPLVNYLAETFRMARPMGNVNRYLLEGTGVDLVRAGCLGCHDDRLIGAQPHTRTEWGQIVDRMIEWGAAVPRTRTSEVVDYLTSHFGH